MAGSEDEEAAWALAMAAALTGAAGHGGTGGSSLTISSTAVGGSAAVSTVSVSTAGPVAEIRVIGGRVWIDGEKVPEDATLWPGRNGRVFRIRRAGGDVTITTE